MFEVWDIPWQGTSTLLKQKCQPKGQSAALKQTNTLINERLRFMTFLLQLSCDQNIAEDHSYVAVKDCSLTPRGLG